MFNWSGDCMQCKAAVLKVFRSPSMVMGSLLTTKAVGAESTVAEAHELGALEPKFYTA